jgi:hypothetical protein
VRADQPSEKRSHAIAHADASSSTWLELGTPRVLHVVCARGTPLFSARREDYLKQLEMPAYGMFVRA